MKRMTDESSLEELVVKWNIKHKVAEELLEVPGDEYVDVMVYANCIDVDVWLRKGEEGLGREEILLDVLPKKLFDSWDGDPKWHRVLVEYTGDFKVYAKGLREFNGEAMRITINLYHADGKGCKVSKIEKLVTLYVSDCDVLEEDPRP